MRKISYLHEIVGHLSYGAHSLEYRILHRLTLPLQRVRQTGLAGWDCWRSRAGVMGKSTPAEQQTIAPYPSPTLATVSPLVFPWKLEHVPAEYEFKGQR